MLVLSRGDIRDLVPMRDAIELMKMAFAELSAGRTDSPLRTVISMPDREADALFMPAFVPAMNALGLKAVNVFRRNASKGLPVITAVVLLADPETGEPLAIMDGTFLTALRTGAVTGAAADLLARPPSASAAGERREGWSELAIPDTLEEDVRARFGAADAADRREADPLEQGAAQQGREA